MRLVHEDTGIEVVDGEVVTDFRGDKCIVAGREEPRSPASTGRVYVRPTHGEQWTQGYYPSVFNLKWIEREDR
jgi:hypothetical protein